MRPLELTRSGIAGTIAVFVVAIVCVRLGLWQLERRDQRLERNSAIAARLAEPPVSPSSPPRDTTGLSHRRGLIRGRYDNTHLVVLGGRSMAGAPGVHLFAPLRTGDGAILVNRGWLPSRDAATIDLGPVAVDTTVVVSGVLLPLPETGTAKPAEGFRTRWFRLDSGPLRAQFPYPVSPLYLQAEGSEGEPTRWASPLGSGDPVPLPPPSLDAGPHLSYALQWFSFALIFVVGWAAMVMRPARGPAARSGTTSGP